MIITVFTTGLQAVDHWQAQLLEHSWALARQPGELVRLVAGPQGAAMPVHSLARVVHTASYCPHPYIGDEFRGYDQPASLLQWLVRERVDASLLVLDPQSLMLEPVQEEVAPGEAVGNTWRAWPNGGGPFGLDEPYRGLEAYCVNPKLKPPRVQFPLMIHSSDLRRMAARWLELTALIRCESRDEEGRDQTAHQVAYTIAAAEYSIPHRERKLAVVPGDRRVDRSLLAYQQPVESARGEIVWDPEAYVPWSEPVPGAAKAGAGRAMLERLREYVLMRESGEHLRWRRPHRNHGVREARLPDRTVLEIPGVEQPLNLNSSASAIWELCDNHRTLADIADVLEQRFEVSRQVLCTDIDLAITHLHNGGAIDLEIVDP